jgi:hypothetical protein
LPALRAPTGAREAPSVSKNKAAFKTFAGANAYFFPPCTQRSRNVGKMLADLFLLDFHLLRQLLGIHLGIGQKRNYLLA